MPAHPGREPAPPSRLIRFNKPYGVLSQFTPEGRWRGLGDFIDLPGVYVAGRLDADSEGLLLLTGDGHLQARIADPRFKMEKVYWVQVEGVPEEAALAALRCGVQLRDGLTRAARARLLEPPRVSYVMTQPAARVRPARACWSRRLPYGSASRRFACASPSLPRGWNSPSAKAAIARCGA
jgi:23S rRNA pseudouridine2457 synthase